MRISAMMRLRCPGCLRGPIYSGLFRMHDECPECGIRFERGPGYFLGAMYFSYAMSILAAAPVGVVLWFQGVGWVVMSVVLITELSILSPLIFRLSRSMWLHLDQTLDPRP